MRTSGTVKWFNDTKGYGFITPEGGKQDCFVHYSSIAGNGFRTLAEGQRVEFDLVEGQKGLAAENVALALANLEEASPIQEKDLGILRVHLAVHFGLHLGSLGVEI